jgi:hypothetical protein
LNRFYLSRCPLFEGTDPNAGIIKKFKQTVVNNMTTSHTLGFRLAGMKAHASLFLSHSSMNLFVCVILYDEMIFKSL